VSNANKFLVYAGICAATTAMLEKIDQLGPIGKMGDAYLDISIYTFAISTAGALGISAYHYTSALFPETTTKLSDYCGSLFSSRPQSQEDQTGSYEPPRPLYTNL
jgi:hypothetical protein